MGIIYRLISPSGKMYYGQTKRPIEQRWRKHELASQKGEVKNSCHAINRAIRKYGWENIVKEIIEYCDDKFLNEKEIYYISENNSMYPYGYNLTSGGAGCVHVQSEFEKLKRSRALRKTELTKNLPMYVKYRKTKFGNGFIYDLPGNPAVQFTSPLYTLEENLALMLEYLAKLENKQDININQRRKYCMGFDMEIYISYQQRIDGFVVNKPNHPRKTFSNKQKTLEERYNNAKEYLESLY